MELCLDARPQGYTRLLADLQSFLQMEKIWQSRALNQIKVQIYWKIGERICREIMKEQDRANYGIALLKFLAKDLKLSQGRLENMAQFYRCYPFCQHLCGELTWNHYRRLITLTDENVRRYYEIQAVVHRWSVRDLEKSIAQREHEIALDNGLTPPSQPRQIPQRDTIFKTSYNLPFLALSPDTTEEELEDGLTRHMEKFLLELGFGFAFMGRQHSIIIGGQTHRIDMLFFHTLLCCYVIIELKIDRFRDEFVGQINKYLNYFQQRESLPYMREPIGLIICKSRQTEEVYYALGGLENKIFVAEYRLCLPSEEQITTELKKIPYESKQDRLSQREKRALQALKKKQTFTAYEYHKQAGISLATAKRDLKHLVELGILQTQGRTRSTVYRHTTK